MEALEEDVQQEVVNEMNEKFGLDLFNFDKCKQIHESYVRQREQIKSEIDFNNSKARIFEQIHALLKDTDNGLSVAKEAKDLLNEMDSYLSETNDIRLNVQEHLDKFYAHQLTLQYLKVLKEIEYYNDEIKTDLGKKNDERTVTDFANLCEIGRNLESFKGQHLKEHLRETIHYWHKIIKNKLGKDFDEVLKLIKWPFVNTNFSLVVPMPTHIQKLQIISEYLLQIEIPSESSIPTHKSGLLSEFEEVCLPVQLLIEPLRKRFLYHFYGSRQTNRPDKPEWYFTQVLTWIRDHQDFVDKWVQPVVQKLGLHHIDAKLELMRGLVQLAVEKLHSDLPNMQFDDFTFSHAIDEALGFDKELKETYDYPKNQPGVLNVLTQAQVFVKWITMEKKYATEKMDAMLSPSSPEAFEPLASDIEDLKITTCADAFIILQQTITERYESLPQPGHRLQFLELQLELFDDFRVRLLQLVNAEEGDLIESKIPMIANSIYYVENVLVDWGSMLHYLNLYYYKSQLEERKNFLNSTEDELGFACDMETENVFGETLALYRHMRKDLLCTLAETVIVEIKSKSRPYRRERWSSMVVEKEFRTLSLTPSACPIFEVIAKRLHQLQKSLASKLFSIVWKWIAQQLDTYLLEDLVLDSRFNEGGALQLKYDVVRNLLPLFSTFSEKPENYFTQLIESCSLLNVSKGTALLLRETLLALEGATGVEDTRGRALKEVGVTNFTSTMAIKILNQRTDITVNRIAID